MRAKDAVGEYGERIAVRHLAEAGLEVVERNWRCDLGEIDVVAVEGDVLVVCEVKTRSSESFGTPAEALTPVKLRRQWRLAARWLAEHQPPHRPPVREVRVDLVAVLLQRRGRARVEHVRGV